MDNIIQINILKHCFDFQRALIGIHAIFKEKNVKNYLLFSEMDLRNRWTKLEMEKFRKENDNTFYYLKKEDAYPEDMLVQIEGKVEDVKEIKNEITEKGVDKKEKNEELQKNNENNLFKINIKEGDIDDDNKGDILIESHNE